MDEVYDLLQHTHFVVFPWGDQSVDDNGEDTVQIDVSREKLYQLFKKGKDSWDQDDLFTLTAVSDFIRLSVEELIKDSKEEIKDRGALHYVLLVPSEWEEEIREVLFRPIFVQANLISKDDHQDRLLFCSDVESIYYSLSNLKVELLPRRGSSVDQVGFNLNWKSLFDFSGSVTRPKIINSKEMSLTSTMLKMKDEEEASYLMKPFITDENISELDKHQEERIKSIRPFDICAEITQFRILTYTVNRVYYQQTSAISSSIFLNSKPDAIMNIDILLESTVLSFSLLDENGLVKEIWNHDYFVPDISLRSLGSFFTFSEVVTLNVKNSFITFVEEYLVGESNISSIVLNKDMLIEIENILSAESHNKDIMVSMQQQVYIKAFVSIYMIYMNVIVSRKMPKIAGGNDNIKTGYAITIEKTLLQRLLVTEDDLRDMIYAS
ncbi:hypothetical protein BDF21DRAFT_457378, partial [Thamnidium elegans]